MNGAPNSTRHVVACLIRNGDRFALFRRSVAVRSDPGAWHCITGYLEAASSPRAQALAELNEEAGLAVEDIDRLVEHPPIWIDDGLIRWIVHPFDVHVARRTFRLNWENTEYVWVSPVNPPDLVTVWWLPHMLRASEGEDGAECGAVAQAPTDGHATIELRAPGLPGHFEHPWTESGRPATHASALDR